MPPAILSQEKDREELYDMMQRSKARDAKKEEAEHG